LATLIQHLCRPEPLARFLHQTKPQDWSNVIWALASAGFTQATCLELATLIQHLCRPEPLARFVQHAQPQHWSNVIWALASAGFTQATCPELATLIQHLCRPEPLARFVQHAKPQDWSNLIWALASAGFTQATCLHVSVFSEHLLLSDVISRFNPQVASIVMWGFSKTGHLPPKMFSALATHIRRPDIMGYFTAPAFAQVYIALYTTFSDTHAALPPKVADEIKALMHDLARRTVQVAMDLEPQHVSNILNALATLQLDHPDLLQTLKDRSYAVAPSMNDQSTSISIWSWSRLSQPLPTDLTTRAMLLLPTISMPVQVLSNAAWGLAVQLAVFPSPAIASALCDVLGKLHRHDAVFLESVDGIHAHQFVLSHCALVAWCRLNRSTMRIPFLPESVNQQALQHTTQQHQTNRARSSSSLHKGVRAVLRELQCVSAAVEEEVLVHGFHSVDFRVRLATGEFVLLDVDGPTHDVVCLETGQRRTNGPTLLKQWLLQTLSREPFVRFSHQTWNSATTLKRKQELLTNLLTRAAAAARQPKPAHAIESVTLVMPAPCASSKPAEADVFKINPDRFSDRCLTFLSSNPRDL
jgi:hypothetical protein